MLKPRRKPLTEEQTRRALNALFYWATAEPDEERNEPRDWQVSDLATDLVLTLPPEDREKVLRRITRDVRAES